MGRYGTTMRDSVDLPQLLSSHLWPRILVPSLYLYFHTHPHVPLFQCCTRMATRIHTPHSAKTPKKLFPSSPSKFSSSFSLLIVFSLSPLLRLNTAPR